MISSFPTFFWTDRKPRYTSHFQEEDQWQGRVEFGSAGRWGGGGRGEGGEAGRDEWFRPDGRRVLLVDEPVPGKILPPFSGTFLSCGLCLFVISNQFMVNFTFYLTKRGLPILDDQLGCSWGVGDIRTKVAFLVEGAYTETQSLFRYQQNLGNNLIVTLY